MICFLLSASASLSLFLVSCLVPCVGKLQTKPERKMLAVGWWHRFAKKPRVTSTGDCTSDFNLIHFPLPTRMRIICFSVGRSEKRSFTAFRDGKWLDEMAVTRWDGGRHCSSQDGERLEDEMEAECGFYELGSEYSDPSHCQNFVEINPPWSRCGQSIISDYWEISFLQTESGETSAKSRDTWTRIKRLKPSFHWHMSACSAHQGEIDIQVMKASKNV